MFSFGTKIQNDTAFCTSYEYGVYEATEQGRTQPVRREIFTEFCRLSRAVLSKLLQILFVAAAILPASK
ncbi:hypothetical protein [uncultured Campylobacter sp.]|uniref:hypothetical protein n=1 Tax=uncultured Campylobacter sp. TaxID=218934 RepID=UPI00260A9830|nr:hypothetical protein [uncultured Campylobacter sp.]